MTGDRTQPADSQRLADYHLAQAAASGERHARKMLVKQLLGTVRTTTGYLAPNSHDADDMMQSALIQILRSIASYRGESTLRSWAHRITVRTAMRSLRQQRRTREVADRAAERAVPPVRESADAVERRELRRDLNQALQKLGPKLRTALVLRHVHGHNIVEIAEMVDAPVETVRDRLKRARKKLRRTVAKDPRLQEWAVRTCR